MCVRNRQKKRLPKQLSVLFLIVFVYCVQIQFQRDFPLFWIWFTRSRVSARAVFPHFPFIFISFLSFLALRFFLMLCWYAPTLLLFVFVRHIFDSWKDDLETQKKCWISQTYREKKRTRGEREFQARVKQQNHTGIIDAWFVVVVVTAAVRRAKRKSIMTIQVTVKCLCMLSSPIALCSLISLQICQKSETATVIVWYTFIPHRIHDAMRAHTYTQALCRFYSKTIYLIKILTLLLGALLYFPMHKYLQGVRFVHLTRIHAYTRIFDIAPVSMASLTSFTDLSSLWRYNANTQLHHQPAFTEWMIMKETHFSL